MSVIEVCAVISAIAATASLIASLANSWKISIVHRETNSMKDQLVSEVRANSLAKGILQGKAELALNQDRKTVDGEYP